MKNRLLVGFAILALLLTACGAHSEGRWHTHDAFSRPTLAGGTGAAYFLLHNATDSDDALIGASSSIAETVEVHISSMMAESGEHAESHEADHDHSDHGEDSHDHGMSDEEMHDMSHVGSMVKVERVDVAAGHEIAFEPGGYHIMLINLQQELVAGDTFELTLHFEHAEDLTIQVKVQSP